MSFCWRYRELSFGNKSHCITYFHQQSHPVATQPPGKGARRAHHRQPEILKHPNHREGKQSAAFVLIFPPHGIQKKEKMRREKR